MASTITTSFESQQQLPLTHFLNISPIGIDSNDDGTLVVVATQQGFFLFALNTTTGCCDVNAKWTRYPLDTDQPYAVPRDIRNMNRTVPGPFGSILNSVNLSGDGQYLMLGTYPAQNPPLPSTLSPNIGAGSGCVFIIALSENQLNYITRPVVIQTFVGHSNSLNFAQYSRMSKNRRHLLVQQDEVNRRAVILVFRFVRNYTNPGFFTDYSAAFGVPNSFFDLHVQYEHTSEIYAGGAIVDPNYNAVLFDVNRAGSIVVQLFTNNTDFTKQLIAVFVSQGENRSGDVLGWNLVRIIEPFTLFKQVVASTIGYLALSSDGFTVAYGSKCLTTYNNNTRCNTTTTTTAATTISPLLSQAIIIAASNSNWLGKLTVEPFSNHQLKKQQGQILVKIIYSTSKCASLPVSLALNGQRLLLGIGKTSSTRIKVFELLPNAPCHDENAHELGMRNCQKKIQKLSAADSYQVHISENSKVVIEAGEFLNGSVRITIWNF